MTANGAPEPGSEIEHVPVVFLAAGLGSRFGGIKPLAPVGPNGEPLLAISMTEAARAGFRKAVVVVSEATGDAVRAALADAPMHCTFREQPRPPRRSKPLGTVAAVASTGLTGRLIVVNGDDLYGDGAWADAAAWISRSAAAGTDGAAILFPVSTTLDGGSAGVSRATTEIDSAGHLLGLVERRDVIATPTGALAGDGTDIAPGEPVSMNMWCLGPRLVAALTDRAERFTAEHQDDSEELGLPDALGAILRGGNHRMDAIVTSSRWLGVTWPDDVERVRRALHPLPDGLLAAFGIGGLIVGTSRLTGGHIHSTFRCVTTTDDVVAQAINAAVFRDLTACEANIDRIDRIAATATATAESGGIGVPRHRRTAAGRIHWVDADGTPWRVSDHAAGTEPGRSVPDAHAAFEAARAFGAYDAMLATMAGGPLVVTLPAFHDLAARAAAFEAAVAADRLGRAGSCSEAIAEARRLLATPGLESGHWPPGRADRPVHNDAKVANLRVDAAGRAVMVVDLDTTMPGSVLFDLGELLRTATADAPEDSDQPDAISVDPDRVEAVVRGFVTGLAGAVPLDELRAGAGLAGVAMSLENAIRMLADHLDGDVYFPATRPDHNLIRARAQLRMASALLDLADVATRSVG